MTGALEPANEPYALAKLAGIGMCQSYNKQYGTKFIFVVPANVYGVNDNFSENGHVLVSFGWQPTTSLEEGIRETYLWYMKCVSSGDQRLRGGFD